MPASTPNLRLARLLNEGGRFKVELPDQQSIDVTPDVIATLAGIGAQRPEFERAARTVHPASSCDKESIPRTTSRRDVPTGVQIP